MKILIVIWTLCTTVFLVSRFCAAITRSRKIFDRYLLYGIIIAPVWLVCIPIIYICEYIHEGRYKRELEKVNKIIDDLIVE